jgi:5'-deoxynucleotidase YfbR-like HD superfamily hydrolase
MATGPGITGATPPRGGGFPQAPREFDISGLSEEWQNAIRTSRTFIRSLSDSELRAVLFAANEYVFAENAAQLRALLAEALLTDGAHHKQWYLEKIAEVFVVDLGGLDYPRGIAP